MTFDEFEYTAAELLGIEPGGEARDFADTMEAAGLPYEAFDVTDKFFWEIGVDAADPYYEAIEDELPEDYPLDPRFPDDDYLDPGEEWEITATYGDD